MQPVYLDHNATTPLSGTVRNAMEPYLEGQYGNPLTSHVFGAAPRAAIDAARADVLRRFGADSAEFSVVFGGGGTEALNHALKGLAFGALENGRAGARRRIVIGATEHYAVKRASRWLADTFGFEVVSIAPDASGVVPARAFLEQVEPGATLAAALHWANNETGTIEPVEETGAACRERGVPFVCDAVQVVGKLPLDGAAKFSDFVVIGAHKFYGPKGVGALLARRAHPLVPLIHGASQEESQRAGTHNVAGIVGLAVALNRADGERVKEVPRLARLRDLLWKQIHESIDGAHWNGQGGPTLPNTLNLSFDGCPSFLLCQAMDRLGFAISGGAACLSGKVEPSANLLAMGLPESRARTSVRVSLGHATSDHAVRSAGEAFARAVAVVRRSA